MNQQPDDPAQPPSDQTGWAQPPAPQGPPGAFVNRQPATPGAPLPAGAGGPLQPGPPVSVEAPIRDTTVNLGALAIVVAGVIVALLVVVVLFVVVGGLLANPH